MNTNIQDPPESLPPTMPVGISKTLKFWNEIAPFFVSAALFLSGFFSIFAPLPFLVLGVGSRWRRLALAIATNSALVYFSSGPTVFQFYLLAVGSIGICVPYFIQRRKRPEQVIARTWLVQWAVVGLFISVYAYLRGVTPFAEVRTIFSDFFDLLMASLSPEAREQLVVSFGGGTIGLEEWRKKTLIELPGALGILCLVVAWFNLRVLIYLNPYRFLQKVDLDRGVMDRWKNPDWLVWPTLVAWTIVLFVEGPASHVALNVFKVLMAAYGVQGLAVMATLFAAYKVRRVFRMALYVVVTLLMVPLLLSIGFFDQWFDFRAKFRQS